MWDGDQILYELRAPGGDNLSGAQLDDTPPYLFADYKQFGWVAYTHGPGLDAPLDLIRMEYNGVEYTVLPHTNWRGEYGAGTDTLGAQYGFDVQWPADFRRAFHDDDSFSDRGLPEWFGSLIQGKRDQTGLMYMRNRYYDPNSGRFTQEDPIGLAGGLNLYGFANGDPVNFSDPFGLCPPEDNDPCNVDTGDPNLDDPKRRNVMERGYKTARLDEGGYRLEQGGVCYKDGQCVGGKNATREHIDISIDGKRPVQFDWHTHGNVGRPRQSGIPGDMYTHGVSDPDLADAAMVYSSPVLALFGNNGFPTYILDDVHIYRITPGAGGQPAVTTFNRWKQP